MSLPQNTENIFTTDAIVVELTLLVAFTAGLVWYYRAKDVPFGICFSVFLSWLLGFLGTLLLPADIVLTLLNGTHRVWITTVWYTVYWTTFLLAWVVLPILYEAWQSGELTWGERLKAAVRLNIRQYLLMTLGMIVFVIYLVISGQTSAGSVSGFMMALANTYGLLFIILLLGHGLIQVPRQLWETSFNDKQLQRLYFIATQVDTDMHESFFELEEVERNVDSLERAMESTKQWHVQDRTHLKQMLEALRVTEKTFHEERDDGSFRTARFMGKHGSQRWDDGRTPAEAFLDLGLATITIRDAAKLHYNLRAAQVKVVATKNKWEALLRETATLQCLLNKSIPWGMDVCETTSSDTLTGYYLAMLKRVKTRASWIWRAYLRSISCRALAVVCALLSGLILWSEVVAASRWNLSPFGILLRCMYEQEAGVAHTLSMQAAVLVPFLYMSLCCYRSLFTLRIFGDFTLQGGHHSLPGPLLFNAQYLIRLQFPLGYNFMRILRYYGTASMTGPALQLPAFQNLMNDMTTVPVLGTSFNIYAPMVLVVLCMFTFYKGYARVLRLVGLDHEDLVSLDDPDGKARLDEGRALLERGKRQAHVLALRRQGESTESPTASNGLSNGQAPGYVAPSVGYTQIENVLPLQDPEEDKEDIRP